MSRAPLAAGKQPWIKETLVDKQAVDRGVQSMPAAVDSPVGAGGGIGHAGPTLGTEVDKPGIAEPLRQKDRENVAKHAQELLPLCLSLRLGPRYPVRMGDNDHAVLGYRLQNVVQLPFQALAGAGHPDDKLGGSADRRD